MNKKDGEEMKKDRIMINDIPAIRWGEDSNRIFMAVHGKMSHKEDPVIGVLSEEVVRKGYQLISFDLPEHGERCDERAYPWNIPNGISDLETILDYVKGLGEEISLFGCSLGAYFSLIALKTYPFRQTLFLSPVVNMVHLIEGMMKAEQVTADELKKKEIIKTSFGEQLEWEYYEYVKTHPVFEWKSRTSILCGGSDEMILKGDILDFCSRFSCRLEIMEGSGHFFHTERQLEFLRKWITDEVTDSLE